MHVVLDASGVENVKAITRRREDVRQPQKPKICVLEISGEKCLVYHKLSKSSSASSEPEFEGIPQPAAVQRSDQPRQKGKFTVAVTIDPAKYYLGSTPVITRDKGICQVSIPKAVKPAHAVPRRPTFKKAN